MGFLSALARLAAADQLRRLGAATLAEGREVFVAELARGQSQRDAANTALRHMLRQSGRRGRDALGKAARGLRDRFRA
ncbi:MAG: hypothetical protein AB7D57_02895 [Desulfovibrionaceae bacterium]